LPVQDAVQQGDALSQNHPSFSTVKYDPATATPRTAPQISTWGAQRRWVAVAGKPAARWSSASRFEQQQNAAECRFGDKERLQTVNQLLRFSAARSLTTVVFATAV
jgi:hypothetical protein